MLATTDGGRAWTPVDLPGPESAVTDGMQLLPGGDVELLERSRAAWFALSSRDGRTSDGPRAVPFGAPGPDGAYNRLSFTDRDHWALADGRRLVVTADAGLTWRAVEVDLPSGLAALRDLAALPGQTMGDGRRRGRLPQRAHDDGQRAALDAVGSE